MTDRQLPNGWSLATLGDLGHYQNGRAFSDREWSSTGRPIIRIQNLTGTSSTYNYFEGHVDEKHLVRAGDLLVSWAATLGVFVWHGAEAALNQHIFKVTSRVDPAFHRWAVEHTLDELRARSHGSGMVHVTKGVFDSAVVPLPPLQEQSRIANEIERRLSHVDAAERDLNRLLEKLAVVRSVIIHSAMTGHLLAVGDGHAPADAERGTDPDVSTPPIPPNWRWSLLKDILREPMRNGRSAPTAPAGTGVRVYAITAVTRRDWGLHHTKWAVGDPDALTDLFVKDGDIFVQRSNTPELVGTSALYRGPDGVSTFPDLLIRVRPNDNVVPEWLEAVLMWSATRNYLRSVASGLSGSMPKIDQGKVGKVPVPMPPRDEQLAILAEMNRRLSRVDAAARAVQGGLQKCAQVRKSVLKSAFAGQLVIQDSSEEPARVLLDRIKEQRQADTAAKKPARKTRAKKEMPK